MAIKKVFEKAFILVFWIILWWLLAALINSAIFPAPVAVFDALLKLLTTPKTYYAIGSSLIRVLISLVVGVLLGTIVGLLASVNTLVKHLFKPLLIITKSTPVVCFIIILWLYFDKVWVPSICGVLLCFPIIYTNITEGFSMVDDSLINMSKIYRVPLKRMLLKLYVPSILPFLFAGILTSIGICWKATIAAEVISILDGSVGMYIYNGKVLLEFNYVFAWTLIIIICSLAIEVITKYWIDKVAFHDKFEVI